MVWRKSISALLQKAYKQSTEMEEKSSFPLKYHIQAQFG